MRRQADRRVLHAQVVADCADQDIARVQPDADLQSHTMSPSQILCETADLGLHGEGGVAGSQRMVFEREWGPKECHDAIAHDLVHGAFVAMDGLDHAIEDGVEQLTGLLGVAVGEQFQRSLDISEEDRNLLTFAFDGRPLRQDPFGQVARRVVMG
jgi:hypothetical protein